MNTLGKKLTLNDQGFLVNWLISGIDEQEFVVKQEEKDQIKYEQYLRAVGIDDVLQAPPINIKLGEKGCHDHPWIYYYSKNNWFVDMSTTCSVPTKIEGYAVTEITVPETITVKANIWTYPALDLWLDDLRICSIRPAVYKPMTRNEIEVKLTKGKHRLFIRFQNVGVRDTRNIFGIQIKNHIDQVEVSLPDQEALRALLNVENWLNSIIYKDNKIQITGLIPEGATMTCDGKSSLIQSDVLPIDKTIKKIMITVSCENQNLIRSFEIGENQKPKYMNEVTLEATHQKIYEDLAKIPYQLRGSGAKFSVYHVLARYAVNAQTAKDKEYLLEDLKHIEARVDCSDFLLVGILRLMKKYKLDADLLEAIKKAVLNYRYWMDEDGSDGMCFWSENHALMFHGSQMLAGQMYSDELFIRSKRLGKEQEAYGEARSREWLDEVEKYGFEEFISATYTAVTVVALLNLIDFGPEDISRRASSLLDHALELLSRHIFDGVIIGPQGRVYRDVIYPFKQSAQAFVHFMNKELPTVIGTSGAECMWLAVLATSKYKLPIHLNQTMGKEIECIYTSDEAKIHLKKTKDYILTSVESPREDYIPEKKADPKPFSTPWVKEMNIKYHGKTRFEPGVYGYQQHMWYAALAKDCPIFANHPGVSTDDVPMRPGYWYGNGVFPALKQKGNILAAIYYIGEDHPIHFTHLYWPTHNFDEMCQKNKWIFGKKGNGYVGVWCSELMVPYSDVLIDREYRAYGNTTAYVCQCGSKEEHNTFEEFQQSCLTKSITFDEYTSHLIVAEEFDMTFLAVRDETQYI